MLKADGSGVRVGLGGGSSERDAVIPKRGGGCFCATWLEELGMGR